MTYGSNNFNDFLKKQLSTNYRYSTFDNLGKK